MVAYVLRGILITGLVMLAGGAFADPVPAGGQWDKFNIQLGGFLSRSNSEIQLNNTNTGVGAVVDLEDSLNVSSSINTVRLDTLYRFGQTGRHQVEFHYFESKRSGVRTLSQDLTIGDKTYLAGTTLNTEFDLAFANFDYAYAVMQDDRVRLALSAGLHTAGVGLKISSSGLAVQEDQSFTAPLPVVGFRLDVALAKNWKFKTTMDALYLEYDGYTGALVDSFLAVEWDPFKHVGFGLGLNRISYRIEGNGGDASGMDFNGKVDLDITGLLLYARYFF